MVMGDGPMSHLSTHFTGDVACLKCLGEGLRSVAYQKAAPSTVSSY